jgi:hypothetical protein
VLTVQGSTYRLEGEFKDNKPVTEANQILYIPAKKAEDTEEVKGKKAPPAKGKKGAQEEEFPEDGKNRIMYEYQRATGED